MNWRMGLLAKLTVFDKPEAALEKKLKQNSCYPFKRVDDPGPNPGRILQLQTVVHLYIILPSYIIYLAC